MSDLDVDALAGQVLVAGFQPGEEDEALGRVRAGRLGGIILFRRNVGPLTDVAALLRRFVDATPAGLPLLVAVDQEGGRVERLRDEPILRLPPMRELAAQDDPELTREAARALGEQLAMLGFTMDFAPVLDVDTNPDNPVIGDRSFGRDAQTVARHGLAFAAGLEEAGLLSCAKHFPGHGDTDLDSHLALPRLSHDRARLDRVELEPFRRAVGRIPAVMTAHVVFDALDPRVPATLSRRVVTGLLREELGWEAVVVSDDLEMKAVMNGWSVPDAAVLAIEAGCDQLLVCSRLDLLEEARVALASRARMDPAFHAVLAGAARRGLAMRRGAPPRPLPAGEDLLARLATASAEAVRARLGRNA